jgi:hypothetical protein
MGQLERNANVQDYGSMALEKLACNNAQNRIAFAKEGGIGVIVAGMRQNQVVAEAQQNVCRAREPCLEHMPRTRMLYF